MSKRKWPIPQRAQPKIDPDTVLELVRALGGYQQVAERWMEEGVLNPVTRRPYSKHSVKRYAKMSKGFPDYEKSRRKVVEAVGAQIDDVLKRVQKEQRG